MTKASIATNRKSTIDRNEAAHFGALAADWWDPKGSSAMLHKLNPVRLGFIRRMIDAHFGGDERSIKPLAGKTALDVGCGAGLLCEPLARMGAAVTGVDAAPENIAAAAAHAAQSGLKIDYRAGELSAQKLGQFDLVTSMEVIEHVTDPEAFVAELAARLKSDGLLIMSTPNRTAASRLFLVEAAERLGQVPRGTHDWDRFLTPDELTALLNDAGLEVTAMEGIALSPLRGLHLSENKALNYILAARHSGRV
ncbi:MAG: bifunctional 2-polyprenyl-6-hydroxyphenol methylase/3-demethylubiquinol 3-O-methyltransferase UbiG [Casimicrobium sp.]